MTRVLHVYPCSARPLANSAALTRPCMPSSGRDPGPQRARGTAVGGGPPASTSWKVPVESASAKSAARTNRERRPIPEDSSPMSALPPRTAGRPDSLAVGKPGRTRAPDDLDVTDTVHAEVRHDAVGAI